DPFCGARGGTKRYCPPWKSPRERCFLYHNLGNGRFQDVSREMGISRLEAYWFQPFVIDYNEDGWPDVAVIADGPSMALYRADRDGWRDAFSANGHIDDYVERFDSRVTYAERPLFYRNRRGERFAEIGIQAGPAFAQKMVARGCAVADYDQDGDPDLVVTENN